MPGNLFYKLHRFKIIFSDSKNCHFFPNVLFNELNDFKKLDESAIICSSCGTIKNEAT